MVKIVVVKADTYDEQVVALAMKEMFDELGDISQSIKLGDKVLLKPNMLEPIGKDYSVTTHLSVVADLQLIRNLKQSLALVE